MCTVIIVDTDDAERYPPELSVINALSMLEGIELVLCSLRPSNYIKQYCHRYGIKLIDCGGVNTRKTKFGTGQFIKKAKVLKDNKEKLWNAINSVHDKGDILWICMYSTLKMLGNKVLKYKYVIHLYELIHEMRIYYRLPYPQFDLSIYLRKAYKVVECEYNRAQITKAWFDLPDLPVVLPNKLYLRNEEEADIGGDDDIRRILEKIGDKKIILFQGGMGKERPIEPFVEAVGELGDEFTIVVVSGDKINLSEKPDNLIETGFIKAPFHLAVTRNAYIGILMYQSSSRGYAGNDCLNSVYCAPNKVYEYSKYGLPMIGNDIPGLKYTIETSKSGICIKNISKNEIKKAIIKIDEDYNFYKQNSLRFYNEVNIKQIIEKEIISEVLS